METVEEVLLEELKDLYDAEKILVRALPKMARAASTELLQKAFREHLEQTKEQVTRLEQVFDAIGEPPKKKVCKGMRGLLEEGEEIMQNEPGLENDLALIGAAQRVEHYEIAAYGTARTLADALGNDIAAELLQQTLDEEKETDERLSGISGSVLAEAEMAGEEEDAEGAQARRGMARETGRTAQSTRRRASSGSSRR